MQIPICKIKPAALTLNLHVIMSSEQKYIAGDIHIMVK